MTFTASTKSLWICGVGGGVCLSNYFLSFVFESLFLKPLTNCMASANKIMLTQSFCLLITVYLQSVFALKPYYLQWHVLNICPLVASSRHSVMGLLLPSSSSESQDEEKAARQVLCLTGCVRRRPPCGPGAWCGDSRGRSPGLGHGHRAGAGREEGDGGGEGAEGARQDRRGAAAARRLPSAPGARAARWVTPIAACCENSHAYCTVCQGREQTIRLVCISLAEIIPQACTVLYQGEASQCSLW